MNCLKKYLNNLWRYISTQFYTKSSPHHFWCRIPTPDKVYLIGNHNIKYHYKLRYVSFQCDKDLAECIDKANHPFVIEIISHQLTDPVFYTEIDMDSLDIKENIIDGQRVQEKHHQEGPYSIIVRTPINPKVSYSSIIFCYNNDDLGVY